MTKCVTTSHWSFEWRCQWKVYHQHWQTGRWCVSRCVVSCIPIGNTEHDELTASWRRQEWPLYVFKFLFNPHVSVSAPGCSALFLSAFFWISHLTRLGLSQRVCRRGKCTERCQQINLLSIFWYLLLWDEKEEAWRVKSVFRVDVLTGKECLDCKCEVIVWVGQHSGLMLRMSCSDSEVFLNHVKRAWISRFKKGKVLSFPSSPSLSVHSLYLHLDS